MHVPGILFETYQFEACWPPCGAAAVSRRAFKLEVCPLQASTQYSFKPLSRTFPLAVCSAGLTGMQRMFGRVRDVSKAALRAGRQPSALSAPSSTPAVASAGFMHGVTRKLDA